MRTRLSAIFLSLLFFHGDAFAQGSPIDESNLPAKTFTTSADIEALIARAASAHKPGTFSSEYIAALAPYHVNLEYRSTPTHPAVHLKEAELIYVIRGSGTLTVGGTMDNSKPAKPGNLSGTGISGGTAEPLAPGNFAFVPEGTPHWFSAVTGTGPLVTMAFHVPRPLPAEK
jgi:mannose-6-phosphate isomerase-like protein (cupin superfamily)